MSNMPSPLIDIGSISQPITKLIETVSTAIGNICLPKQMIRVAKAESEVMKIKAHSEADVSQIEWRAKQRINQLEMRRQSNVESIVSNAISQLPPEVDPLPVDEDWVIRFFNVSQDFSNQEMQQLWAKLLAGEIAKPGSFTYRTLDIVRGLTQTDARDFTILCRYIWNSKQVIRSDTIDIWLDQMGLDSMKILNLLTLGLVTPDGVTITMDPGETDRFRYYDKRYLLTYPDIRTFSARIKVWQLTRAGCELAPLCDSIPDDLYSSMAVDELAYQGIDVIPENA